jgi:hypothetical protein
MRVLCLSNMYPGPGAPDYGAFVERMCDALEGHGADVDRVVIRTRASGRLRTPAKYLGLSARAVVAARRADVIWAHYLFPTGLIAAIAGRATRTPWVVTAHGGDVANLSNRTVRRLSGPGVRGAGSVICVSEWLAGRMADEACRRATCGWPAWGWTPGGSSSAIATSPAAARESPWACRWCWPWAG